ncbi:MAG: aminopeptidase, partial [Phycisphaerales bacterium]|nr:aminopeptidase [Phycisphaerales bacterium]
MRDQRLDRLADVIVRYSTRIKRGDLVAIVCDPIALPLVQSVYARVIELGAHPYWAPASEDLAEILLETASDEQIEYVSPIQMNQVETVDVLIKFWAETNTRRFSRIAPERLARQAAARKPYLTRFMNRAAEGDLRWCGTLYPTPASAQDAEMSMQAYEDFVFRAGLLHLADPVAAWQEVAERQQRLRDWLQQKRTVRFRHPGTGHDDATDLTVDVDGATWINCCGHENFPDGEVFAGPQGVDGVVHYSFPGVYQGREVEGIRLEFKAGRCVGASAKKNEEFLISMLDLDEGARTLGEIAIGTNYAIREFTKNTLFDEKIGG